MKRAEITMVAKMLGLKASGKNDEILAAIQEKLDSWRNPPMPARVDERPRPVQRGVQRLAGRKPEDGRKGLHPITGEVIY